MVPQGPVSLHGMFTPNRDSKFEPRRLAGICIAREPHGPRWLKGSRRRPSSLVPQSPQAVFPLTTSYLPRICNSTMFVTPHGVQVDVTIAIECLRVHTTGPFGPQTGHSAGSGNPALPCTTIHSRHPAELQDHPHDVLLFCGLSLADWRVRQSPSPSPTGSIFPSRLHTLFPFDRQKAPPPSPCRKVCLTCLSRYRA